MPEITPMKRQYNEIKAQYQDCLLFFRLGDFYEMFDEDARIASRELDLALTSRDRNVENPEDRTPMCGIPYHSCEAYIGRLIARGYKVAICEQTEDPALAKGLVSRDVIRVITPGTLIESSMLDENKSNYICSVCIEGETSGVAFCDVSTGELCAAGFDREGQRHAVNELSRFMPREAVLNAGARETPGFMNYLKSRLDCMAEDGGDRFEYPACLELVEKRFDEMVVSKLKSGGEMAVRAVGGLLGYIADTQKLKLDFIDDVDLFSSGKYMELDYVTRRNLELTENSRTREKKGSLLWALDKTRTPMGGRLLRSWIERPMLSPVDIKRRLSAVDELFRDNVARGEIRELLRGVGDIPRLTGRMVYGTANARELLSLARYAAALPRLTGLLEGKTSLRLRAIADTKPLTQLTELIERAIDEEAPVSVREGDMIRKGFSEEVDRLREMKDNGGDLIRALEARERERTGIKKLKVGYNKVFGYYIDVPRSSGAPVPDDYIRKQTLMSNERYFTEELKELENSLLSARDRDSQLEYQLFDELRRKAAESKERFGEISDAIAELDALASLAESAVKNGYTMPTVDHSPELRIEGGRHPVVELTRKDTLFVPNDTLLNRDSERVAIITGPNMAGKSTYMRQTALILLMAQMGSFVPAKSAVIGVADRVFTRIGASDDLTSGRSTFMVEMTEVADILNNATRDSLLILDEIGRGTSTYDGMAIARAVLEYCADRRRLGARTMFATHYHELSVLEGELEGIGNYNITARKQGEELIFLRKIVRGAADDSYGIEVAKLAGVPDSALSRARQCLKELEEKGRVDGKSGRRARKKEEDSGQLNFADMSGSEVAERLRSVDLNVITPIEAMNILYELKKKVEI